MPATTACRLALALLTTAAVLLATPALPVARAADAVPGQLLVGFHDGVPGSRAQALVARAGATLRRRLPRIGAMVVRPRSGADIGAVRARLRAAREVRYAEPDYYLRASATPDDPYYVRQYALQDGAGGVGAPAAWGRRTSCALVATLDSGAQYDHPDLAPNIWHNSGEIKANGKDDDHNGWIDDYYGVNVPKGSGSGADQDGHGTHVAGIVAGRGNNAAGIAGLCWEGKVMPVRFLDARGRGSTSDAVTGIDYAVHEGAKIINCSFGSSAKSTALEDAVKSAKAKGVLLVVAAGNDGDSIDKAPEYPAAYTEGNILTVAATDATGTLTSFSNYGSKSVDLAAPGDKVFSTYPTSSYKYLSGTSMAAPLVAAAAAMLRKQDPTLSYGQLRNALKDTVVPQSSLAGRTVTGGVVDVDHALAATGGGP